MRRVAHDLTEIDGLGRVREDPRREATNRRRKEDALECHPRTEPVVGLVAGGEEHREQSGSLELGRGAAGEVLAKGHVAHRGRRVERTRAEGRLRNADI